MNPSYPKVAICIFGCMTKEKYFQQIKTVVKTWAKLCQNFNVKYYFFIETSLSNPVAIQLPYVFIPGAGNDYKSASIKQWWGMEWILRRERTSPRDKFDFMFICGTDTFIHVENLLKFLSFLDPAKELYIGGHGDTRKVLNNDIYYHTGGAGVVLSKASINKIAWAMPHMVELWGQVCSMSGDSNLQSACDVALGFMARLYDFEAVKSKDFWNCSHNGFPCHPHMPDKKSLISCHNMEEADMFNFYKEITS